MNGRIVPFETPHEIDAAVPWAVEHLRRGAVLAHPTETVYGLGTTLDPAALDRLARLKPRDAGRPFVVLIAYDTMLEQLGVTLTGAAEQLATALWPGPLTLILHGSVGVPEHVRNASGAIAVRYTPHAGIRRIIRALGAPMTSTSANVPGVPPAATAQEIVGTWPDKVVRGDLGVLDGGALRARAASTIIDCTAHPPRLVRAGAVSTAEVREVVRELGGVA